MPVPLFDAHCHWRPPGAAAVLCSASPADWDAVAAVAKSGGRAMVGIHPWHPLSDPGGLERLEALLRTVPAGIGEIGLDRARSPLALWAQRDLFIRQLRLAKVLDRPAAVHCVRAWGALLEIAAAEEMPRWLIHGFTGSAESADAAIRAGAFISLCPRRLGKGQLARILKAVPRDRLLVETDYEGADSGEYWILLEQAYEAVAGAAGISVKELAAVAGMNLERFWNG